METNNLDQSSFKTLVLLFSLTLSFFLSSPITSWSQCGVGGLICEESTPIGFPFEGRMSEVITGAGEIIGCNGQGFLHNTTWYSFVPTSPFIFIDVTASNCSTVGGNQGFQIGIFSSCDPNSVPIGQIQCDCASPGQTVTIGGVVTPNETYYILVDGCSGSACDLEMLLTTGTVMDTVPGQGGTPTTPQFTPAGPTCEGATLNFSIPPVVATDTYEWNFPSDVTIVSQNCNFTTVLWGETSGEVFVSAISSQTGDTIPGPPVTVSVEPVEQTIAGSYCGSSSSGFLYDRDNMIYEAGIYNISIPGINCDTLVTLNVTNTQPVLNFTSSNQTCDAEGFATVEVSNVTTAYSFQWSNNANTPTIDNLISGTYSVTVTDDFGCTAEGSVFIDGDFDLEVSSTLTDCDEENGTATVIVSGGISNPSFNWSNGAATEMVSDLSPGFYSVTVTDTDTDCRVHQNVEVSEDPGCSVRISGTAFLNSINPDCITDTTSTRA